MHIKKVTKKDRYGNQVTTEYEVPEKSIDPTRLMEKRMELDQPDMEISMMSMPVGGEEFNMGDPMNHPGEPRGQDTVPAWLTPGEFVVNAEAMSVPGMAQQVEQINEVGRMMKRGGPVYQNTGGIIGDDAMDFAGPESLSPEQIQARMDAMRAASPAEAAPVPVPNMPVPVDPTTALLHAREGYRPDIYLDSLNKPTVGYGHLLGDEYASQVGESPFSEKELKSMFEEDRAKAIQAARSNVGEDAYNKLNRQQQTALNSMAFQLGAGGQRKFKKMIEAIQRGDHAAVAREALTGSKGGKSKWYKQTPKRAMDLAMAFDPNMAAQYKNAGGVVYRDDGGWGNWLKGAANKYILGPNNQFDIPVVDQDPTADLSGGWTPPITNSDLQQAEVWERQYAGQDPDDLGTAGPAVPPMENPEEQSFVDWMFPRWNDPYARLGPDMDHMFSEGDFGEGSEADAEEQIAAGIAESEEYQEMVGRAEAAGVLPPSPTDWAEGVSSGAMARSAPMSDVEPIEEVVEAAQAAGEEALIAGATPEEVADATQQAADEARPEVEKKPTDEEAVSNLDSIIDGRDGSSPDEGDAGPPATADEVDKAGQDVPDKDKKKAESMLGGIFGDLFDGKELARMAIMYAGSRALGYSHTGSLRWAAKNYVNRVDTKVANRDKFATSNVGKFTAASLDAYKESGNLADLVPVGATPEQTGEFKTFYKGGKQVRAQKVKMGDQTVWIGQDGQQINTSYTDQDPKEATKVYLANTTDQIKSLRNQFDAFGEGENRAFKTDINPNTDAGRISEWAVKNNIDPDQLSGLVESAYHEAINDNRQDKSRVRSLVPYLNGLVIRQSVGNPDAFLAKEQSDEGPPQYVDGQKMAALNQSAAALMRRKGLEGKDFDLTNQFYNAVLADWAALPESEQKQWTAKATGDESGFYLYAGKVIQDKFGG